MMSGWRSRDTTLPRVAAIARHIFFDTQVASTWHRPKEEPMEELLRMALLHLGLPVKDTTTTDTRIFWESIAIIVRLDHHLYFPMLMSEINKVEEKRQLWISRLLLLAAASFEGKEKLSESQRRTILPLAASLQRKVVFHFYDDYQTSIY